MSKLNIDDYEDFVVEGVKAGDGPEYPEAFLCHAVRKGTEDDFPTLEELDQLTDDNRKLVIELAEYALYS